MNELRQSVNTQTPLQTFSLLFRDGNYSRICKVVQKLSYEASCWPISLDQTRKGYDRSH